MAEDKTPDPVDIHVGKRLRMRRKDLGYSQQALGDALGLTFQQVQKYEGGSNRISASRLYFTAKTLVVLKSAKITGDVFYDTLTIEQGAMVEGRFAQRPQNGVRKTDEPVLSLAN